MADEGPAIGFLRPFGLPAFASWIILFPPRDSAFLAVGLPSQSLDLDGVSTFRTSKMRLGWAPPLPRDQRYPPSGFRFPKGAWRLAAPGPVTAANTPSRGLDLTGHSQGFTRVRPFSLSLACGSSMAEVPLGLNAELHTPPLPATHVSAGTGPDTGPKSSRVNSPSFGCTYLRGATSCRTLEDQVRFGAFEGLVADLVDHQDAGP